MNRELDPQLFGGPSGGGSAPSAGNANLGFGASSRYEVRGAQEAGRDAHAGAQRTVPGKPVPFPALDIKVLEAQGTQMKAVMQQFDRRLDQLGAKVGELARDTQGRLDKYGQQLLRLEDGLSRLTRDSADRFASVVARVNERKVHDSKVQEMMDRHNLLVRNFENRLESLQRLAGDQEQALLSAFAALEDARAELARLKRMG